MRELVIGGVRATVLGDDKVNPQRKALLVVLAHGRTSSQEASIKLANALIGAVPQLVCVVWDLPNHGSRILSVEANDSWNKGNKLHMLEMLAILDQGATEAATLLRYTPHYLSDLNITHRIICGVSLGGYITWRVSTEHSDLLSASIPVISSPDLPAVMKGRWQQFAQSNPSQAKEWEHDAFPDDVIKSLIPGVRRANALRESSLPVLAVVGGNDPLVPPIYTTNWGKDSGPDQRVEVIPEKQHEVSSEMIKHIQDFLNQFVVHNL